MIDGEAGGFVFVGSSRFISVIFFWFRFFFFGFWIQTGFDLCVFVEVAMHEGVDVNKMGLDLNA